jgi:hypothetical protein
MPDESTPPDLRDEIRIGIAEALARDLDLRGGRTARLLTAAGIAGSVGAAGLTLLVTRHPYGHHPAWHAPVFAAVWSGLLMVTLAFALLRVRTPSLPLARSASVALLGLGVAGLCGAACPDPHFLSWWTRTPVGALLLGVGGPVISAFCFGAATSLFIGFVAVFLAQGELRPAPIGPLLPAAMLLLLLAPGVALQSVGTSADVFAGWLLGTAVGTFVGLAAGLRTWEVLT